MHGDTAETDALLQASEDLMSGRLKLTTADNSRSFQITTARDLPRDSYSGSKDLSLYTVRVAIGYALKGVMESLRNLVTVNPKIVYDESVTVMQVNFIRHATAQAGVQYPGPQGRQMAGHTMQKEFYFLPISGHVEISNSLIRTSENAPETSGGRSATDHITSLLVSLVESYILIIFAELYRQLNNPAIINVVSNAQGVLSRVNGPEALLKILNEVRNSLSAEPFGPGFSNVSSMQFIVPHTFDTFGNHLCATPSPVVRRSQDLVRELYTRLDGVQTVVTALPPKISTCKTLLVLSASTVDNEAMKVGTVVLPGKEGSFTHIVPLHAAIIKIAKQDNNLETIANMFNRFRNADIVTMADTNPTIRRFLNSYQGFLEGLNGGEATDDQKKNYRNNLADVLKVVPLFKVVIVTLYAARGGNVYIILNGKRWILHRQELLLDSEQSRRNDTSSFVLNTRVCIHPDPELVGHCIENCIITSHPGADKQETVHYLKKETESEDIDQAIIQELTGSLEQSNFGQNKVHVFWFPSHADTSAYETFFEVDNSDSFVEERDGPALIINTITKKFPASAPDTTLFPKIVRLPMSWNAGGATAETGVYEKSVFETVKGYVFLKDATTSVGSQAKTMRLS